MENKNKKILFGVMFTILIAFAFNSNWNENLETNILKTKVENKLLEKDNIIKEIEKTKEKEIENVIEEKKEIVKEYTKKENESLQDIIKSVLKHKLEKELIENKINQIELNNCWIEKQKNSNKFDKNAKCEDEAKIKETKEIDKSNKTLKVKEEEEEEEEWFFTKLFHWKIWEDIPLDENWIKYWYNEDWEKLKFLITRYFSPDHSQTYFKNTWKNWKVTFGWNLYPQNEKERWKYFMADWVMQCWTSWVNMPTDKNEKLKVIENIEHSCLVPWISPFEDINWKQKNLLEAKDAEKIIACDYSYIAKITNLGCEPKIYNSTPKEEWEERIQCRKKLNKEVTINIKWIWEVKCADSGWKINWAHFDLWMWIWDEALKLMEKDTIEWISQTDYFYNIDWKKIDTPIHWIYTDVEIYKNWKKVY